MTEPYRVGLVGAGFIADVHAETLSALPGVTISAVVDPNQTAAAALAGRFGIPETLDSVQTLIERNAADCVHVLVPPPLHRDVALPLLRAGIDVLLEKPLAANAAEAADLLATAEASGARLGVNQNFVFDPAFLELRRLIDAGELGPLRHLDCQFNMPLRQLAAGQFGHWMFHTPGNILLEQAVHPLSQILSLAGSADDLTVLPAPPLEISPKVPFYRTWQVSLACRSATAGLFLSVGQEFPFWRLSAICDDGVAVADMLTNRVTVHRRTKWMAFFDELLDSRRVARALSQQGRRNAANYVLSTLKLKQRTSPFFLAMHGSIADFHDARARGATPQSDGRFGAELVTLCERIAAAGGTEEVDGAAPPPSEAAEYDVALFGGTGFIGRYTLERLLADGFRVGVIARNLNNLPAAFHDSRVTLIRGDVTREEDVARGIGSARIVVNLAHGGGGGSWSEIERAMVGSALSVADICLAKGVERLIHVSSIAALYLGDANATVTGAAEPDTSPGRADYSRAKAVAERALQKVAAERGLNLCILRPGLVIGDGTSPFHSGLGMFNNNQHCLGWNNGDNPLPFVLVEDVADAIVTTTRSEAAIGRCYNLVGDVRPSAKEYIAELARATERPLRFHPQSLAKQQLIELGKWLVKRLIGRRVPMPSYRDLCSRGLTARFDCADVKQDLDWRPVAEHDEFVRRSIEVHAG